MATADKTSVATTTTPPAPEPVAEQLVVRGQQRVEHESRAGGVDAEGVAVERDAGDANIQGCGLK